MLTIEWAGKSYTDEIENLNAAFEAVREAAARFDVHVETVWNIHQADVEIGVSGMASKLWSHFEDTFAREAFKDWMEVPDGWSLVCL